MNSEKTNNKKVIIAIFVILVIIAVVLVLFFHSSTDTDSSPDTFLLENIRWDISSKKLKSICKAELLKEVSHDGCPALTYKYQNFEDLFSGDLIIQYFFDESDRLSYIYVIPKDQSILSALDYFDAEDEIIDDLYYSNYNGYNIYVSKGDGYLDITKNRIH